MFTKGMCWLRPCFTGIGAWSPVVPCPVICLTVSDPSELPDPPTGCEFAELRYVDLTGFIITLYQWDGVAWDDKATVSGLFTAGEIEDVNYGFKDAWTATLNGNAVSGAGTYNFAPAVGQLDVVFINGVCSYAMEPAVSTPVALISIFMNDTTLLPFDPTVAANWNGFGGNTQFTDVIVTGTQNVDLYGFVIGNEVFADNLGILQFGTNVLTITDHQGFVTEIAELTFTSSSILGVTFPALQIVGNQAFVGCSGFSGCGSAVITTIGAQAFFGSNMSEGTHLLCTSVGNQAFSGTACATLNFPILETIEVDTFSSMASLTSASFAACLSIGPGAFGQCPLLATVNFPLATSMGSDAFSCDSTVQGALLTASFPEILTCGTEAFRNQGLTSIILAKCTTFELNAGLSYVFYDCLDLAEMIAPMLVNMGNSGDNECFFNIAGNTIAITVPVALATNNGGNPDGDILYLDANNTLTVNYV